MEPTDEKSSVRKRADEIKQYRCKNLIVVLENPSDYKNIGTVIRNVNALGAEKTYIVDSRKSLPDDWQDMKQRKSLQKTSVSAINYSFIKRFDSTEECFDHLERNRFESIVTSPHIKGKQNVMLHKGDFTQVRLAVWFGNEGGGISDLALAKSTFCINIPMYGLIESLNLATATGIVLYEVTKQRRDYQSKYKRAHRRRPIKRPRSV